MVKMVEVERKLNANFNRSHIEARNQGKKRSSGLGEWYLVYSAESLSLPLSLACLTPCLLPCSFHTINVTPFKYTVQCVLTNSHTHTYYHTQHLKYFNHSERSLHDALKSVPYPAPESSNHSISYPDNCNLQSVT